MNSLSFLQTTYRPPPPHSSLCNTSRAFAKHRNPSSLRVNRESTRTTKLTSLNCASCRNPILSAIDAPPETAEDGLAVSVRVRRLVSEFRSLAEPMERVKRLLHYASRLPPHAVAARSPENRVAGCATQVWVEAEMSEATGRLRFRADSDSEIAKGFCSCLVWTLDGATAEEVLGLTTEDFECVNVGLQGKGHSRANTWQNVLVAMQRKTRALVDDRNGNRKKVEPLLSLSVSLPS